MKKTILITGSTDGIGLETAKVLASLGHNILLHGRNAVKLESARAQVANEPGVGSVETYVADLSNMKDVEKLAAAVTTNHNKLDVLINNAGIFKTSETVTAEGQDVRFAVNTLAPYLLTRRLLPLMGAGSRVVNLSSAAQSPVNLNTLTGKTRISDHFSAYAQSKLAITMWTRTMAQTLGSNGPVIVAVNPGSMLGSKMVKEGFGVAGGDLRIGADILSRAALSEEFASANGEYYDNDSGQFTSPHPDGVNAEKAKDVEDNIKAILKLNG